MKIAAALTILTLNFAFARGAEDVPPLSTVRVADSVRSTPAPAQVTPAEIKSKPGRLVSIVANTASKDILWDYDPTLDARMVCDGRELIVVAPASGSRRILCVGSVENKAFLSVTTLTVDDAVPVPPGPTPPLPVPPTPPVPPLPPAPDAMQLALQAAYDDSTGTAAEKSAALVKLTELYKQASKLVEDKARTTTAKQFLAILRAATQDLSQNSLRPLRNYVAGELAKILPDPATEDVLTDGQRKAASDLFQAVAARTAKLKQ